MRMGGNHRVRYKIRIDSSAYLNTDDVSSMVNLIWGLFLAQ